MMQKKKQTVDRFLNSACQVTMWPKKQVDKELVVAYLASKFEWDKSYHEREVNELLKQWHVFRDWSLLRRELYERGYLDRNRSGTNYTKIK